MFKKIIAAIVVISAITGIAKLDNDRKEASERAAARAALQSDIAMGYAPMSWMCKALEMELVVNDDGQPICHGEPRFSGKPVHENFAAHWLAESCRAVEGVSKIAGMKQIGAPALAVRCIGTRFEQRWVAAQE